MINDNNSQIRNNNNIDIINESHEQQQQQGRLDDILGKKGEKTLNFIFR